ncbi:AMP-binding protein [Ahrensia sp. R2A130]|uniref:AMP-binding protein n=1 Tax=Ahrensia sp. R2A130 TaxID=744979 RepID=UPI000681F186|nr:AMP-binding protein [Ahrensia sp. R2A130]
MVHETERSDPQISQSNYDRDLDANTANFAALTPLSFLRRARDVYPHRTAYAYESLTRSWGEVYERCVRFASALNARGIGRGDTVAIIAPNIPEMFELQFAVAMAGAVMNPINIRLDAATIAYILDHGEAKLLVTDTRFAPAVEPALEKLGRALPVIDIVDGETDEPEGKRLGEMDTEAFIRLGDPAYDWVMPTDEWDAISLNYTSGTTSDPKGVVVHHRGAHLIALGTAASWPMTGGLEGDATFPVHMYVVPLFHCNGWGHAWALAATGGMSVLIRNVNAKNLYAAIGAHRVTHFGGAPIVLSMLINATDEERKDFDWPIRAYTAAAPPPPAVLAAVKKAGFTLTHVYGLTETYGHVLECAPQAEWLGKPNDELAELNSRQGVRYAVLEDVMVADPDTMEPVPADGETIGEIMVRGNVVMKGYYRNPSASEAAFAGGWFHTGDLAVMNADGYLKIKDRSKDIIISGGENISSVEIEGILAGHEDVMAAAVVAKPDEKWGETPCAFLELKPGKSGDTATMTAWCRERMASFKVPKTFIFEELPKTSTGKIQKFVLRDRLRDG